MMNPSPNKNTGRTTLFAAPLPPSAELDDESEVSIPHVGSSPSESPRSFSLDPALIPPPIVTLVDTDTPMSDNFPSTKDRSIAQSLLEATPHSSATPVHSRLGVSVPRSQQEQYRRRSVISADSSSIASSKDTATTEADGVTNKQSLLHQCLNKISFSVFVALLMIIPTGFLVIYSSLSFSDAMKSWNFKQKHIDFLFELSECETALVVESAATSHSIAENESLGLVEPRNQVDLHCSQLQHAIESTYESIADEFRPLAQQGRSSVQIMRDRVDSRSNISGTAARSLIYNFITAIDYGRSMIATHPSMQIYTVKILGLKLVHLVISTAQLLGDVGLEILHQHESTIPRYLADEYIKALGSMHGFILQLRGLALKRGQSVLNTIDTNTHWQTFLVIAERLRENVHAKQTFDEYEWIHEADGAVGIFQELEKQFVKDIESDIGESVAIETSKLLIGIVAVVFATVTILRANLFIQRKIDRTLVQSKRMQGAVQRFVPRQFLKMCGYTSILHISAGDETQVATTVLHSQIRTFSVVSSTMDNEELFDWLQDYFKRMTVVTESNHGFVDKFIGDAIFSVFSSPRSAVQCGIDMLKTVGELNLHIICSKGESLLVVGVGIHYAVVSAGFLGDQSSVCVALVSKEITVASKLQSLTKFYGANMLVSQAIADQVGDFNQFEHRCLGNVQIRGSGRPFGVVEVFQSDDLAIKNYKNESKATFEEAVKLRAQRDLVRSTALLERCRTMASASEINDDAVEFKLANPGLFDVVDL